MRRLLYLTHGHYPHHPHNYLREKNFHLNMTSISTFSFKSEHISQTKRLGVLFQEELMGYYCCLPSIICLLLDYRLLIYDQNYNYKNKESSI